MSDTKHTPTPWIVENIMHGGPRIVHGSPASKDGFRDDVPFRESTELSQANAAFIVRSCNNFDALLEACKVALKAEFGTLDAAAIAPGTYWAKMQAAIAAAEEKR